MWEEQESGHEPTLQGVPKTQNYWNNVLLEFECLSTLLNAQMHKLKLDISKFYAWETIFKNCFKFPRAENRAFYKDILIS
jgi:hypothetical protein